MLLRRIGLFLLGPDFCVSEGKVGTFGGSVSVSLAPCRLECEGELTGSETQCDEGAWAVDGEGRTHHLTLQDCRGPTALPRRVARPAQEAEWARLTAVSSPRARTVLAT